MFLRHVGALSGRMQTMKKMRLSCCLLSLTLLSGFGCASGPDAVPENFQSSIDPSLTFSDILKKPENHQGAMVVLGGEVLSAKRLADGTRVEVLQLPLDSSEEPSVDRTSSEGRFFAMQSSFLDPATLPLNTRITLVGEVIGVTNANLDEMEYHYLTVKMKHLHVWPKPELNQSESSGPSFGIFGGGGTGGRVGGGVSIGIGF